MGPELLGIDWAQSWAEAVGAGATAVAFLVAAFEYRRSARERRDAEAGQARLVVRRRRRIMDSQIAEASSSSATTTRVEFQVCNESTKPIHGLCMRALRREGTWVSLRTAPGLLPETLAAGEGCVVYVEPTEAFPNLQDWEVEFEFTDADGRRWRRAGLQEPARFTERRGLTRRAPREQS